MKLARLFQPRNPQFWIFVALNLFSTAISWLLRSRELALPVTLLLAGFAIANMLIGLRIALRLMREPGG
jgi:hypothetical protein